MLKRLIQLSITLAPVVCLYPVVLLLRSDQKSSGDAHEILLAQQHSGEELKGFQGWYLRVCLRCVESSGAAVIKLMQWAGSRPDLFGHEFCAVFSALQDNTRPHAVSHTLKVLKDAYGENWQRKIQLGNIIGSGCIGQVYKGEIQLKNGASQVVAVKVLHPNVDSDIEADLDLMRASVRAARWLPFDVFANLKWLNLEGVVEEFAELLKLQLDLRTEAANLRRFNEHFKNRDDVVFPKLIPGFQPTKDLLVETYIEGTPVIEYARQHANDQKRLTTLCTVAIQAVCKMIFLDNFMHGDLHPGNVVINEDGLKPRFVLYDVGIVAEYSDYDHQTLVDILAAFVRKQGRNAGRLMIDDSNVRLWDSKTGDRAVDEEDFIDKIDWLTVQASSPDYFMEHLGSYITYICKAAAQHHILMNPTFVSAALAVKVEEGIALALDPNVKITNVAIPIIIEAESRRYGAKAKRKLWERIERLMEMVFGRKEERTA
jgi:aarF domain-containing kinase